MNSNIDFNNIDLSNPEDYIELNASLPDELLYQKASMKNRECNAYLYGSQDEKFIDLNPELMQPMISSQDPDNLVEEIERISAHPQYNINTLNTFGELPKNQYDDKLYNCKAILKNDPMFGIRINTQLNQALPINTFTECDRFDCEPIHPEHLYANESSQNDISNDSIKPPQTDEMRHTTRTTTPNLTTNQMQNVQLTWAAKKQSAQPLRVTLAFTGLAKYNEPELSTPQIIDSVIDMVDLTPSKNFDLVNYIEESYEVRHILDI